MSNDWGNYLCDIDGKPASVILDMGIAEEAPVEDLPVMAYAGVDLVSPNADGLSSQAEFDRLLALEDALLEELCDNGQTCAHGLVFVGSVTSDRRRDFFFYIAEDLNWQERIRTATERFSDYTWYAGATAEPDWDTYFDLLYPDDRSRDAMENEKIRNSLEEEGDDLSIPRSIDHFLSFNSEEDRDAFRAEAENLGFAAELDSNAHRMEGNYCVRLTRQDSPEDLDPVTWELNELGGAHGGSYGGWGTYAVNKKQ